MLDVLTDRPKFTRPASHATSPASPLLHGFAAAARTAPGTDGRTDRRTRHSVNTLTAYAVLAITTFNTDTV